MTITMEMIFDNLTVLKNCTVTNPLIEKLGGGGLVFLVGGIVMLFWVITHWWDIDASGFWSVVSVLFTIVGVVLIVGGIVTYNKTPYSVDLYVATNDIAVTELVEYFDVSELTEADDIIACHIEPKPEYYAETLEYVNKLNGEE